MERFLSNVEDTAASQDFWRDDRYQTKSLLVQKDSKVLYLFIKIIFISFYCSLLSILYILNSTNLSGIRKDGFVFLFFHVDFNDDTVIRFILIVRCYDNLIII